MPDFEVTGPDGARYQLTAPDEAAALAAFSSFSGGGDVSRETPVGVNDVVRSAAQGVPVVGSPGLLNRANAVINAAVAPAIEPFLSKGPETLDQPTFGERYDKSLDLQNKRDAKFAKEHPVVDTGAKILGGVAGTVPLVMAAPAAMGATGTIPQMITRGAASGAALGGADAAARGEGVGEGAAVGAVTGAAGGPIGRGIGRVVERVRGRPAAAAPVPRETIDVAGEPVPVPPQDVDQARTIEALRKGEPSAGRSVVEQFDQDAESAVQRATDTIAGDMTGLPANARPTGRATPEEAAQAVKDHLAAQEATRATGERATGDLARLEGDIVRSRLGGPQGRVDSPFEAAEGMGAGLARERTAARAQTRALYDQAGAVPGTFDESVIRTLPDEIRARLAGGSDSVMVDPQTTPMANQALRVLDQDAPEGIFRNMAAPRAPAAPASPITGAAAQPASDAEAAYQELLAHGATHDRARAAVANLPGAESLGGGTMAPHTVATAAGGSVDVKPRVVEASALRTSADAGYDQALQPRNRMRAASDMQINDMAKNLTPHRLGASAEADRGAPIIGADGMVESGNGRVLALRQVYREGGAKAQQYRQWLESQGVDTAGMREPVLVRERTTPMSMEERKAFTVAANQSSTLSLSGAERALADSRALSPETLGLIRNPADLGAVDNRDFVRQFMATVPASERGALMTANGDLSSEGLARVRNAVMAKAYGNTSILARAAESTRDEIKSISSGLQAAAPEWAQLRAAVEAGAVPKELDATAHLLDAVERTAKIRGRGTSLAEGLAQTDAFAAQSPESEAFMRLFYSADGKSAAPASQVGNALRDYAQQAGKVDASPGLGLGLEPVTSRDILANTSKKVGAPAQLAQEVKDAAVAPIEAAAAKEAIPEVDLKRMDNARKRLVSMYSDARAGAQRSGVQSDVRAMGRILNEFDQVIIDAFENGRFSGDGELGRDLIEQARASHAQYRQLYTPRGGSDPIGRDVEKILGRYADTAATPADTLQMTFGPQNNPGGGRQAQLGQRLRQIVGEHSPEWGAAKRSLLSYVEGEGSAVERADRIEKFLSPENGRGRVLSQIYWSPQERAAVASYAQNLRASEPVKLSDLHGINKVMAKITGQLDGVPASDREIINLLAGGARDAGNKGLSVELARTLKRDMTPEAFVKIKQGLFSHVVEKPPGVKEWTDAAIAENLAKFVNSPVALLIYSKDELSAIRELGRAHRLHAPVAGSTNPSGTAHMLQKIASGMKGFALPALGAASHGPLGIVTGMALNKAAGGIAEARAARGARDLLYKPQARFPVDPRFARAGAVLSRGTQAGRH